MLGSCEKGKLLVVLGVRDRTDEVEDTRREDVRFGSTFESAGLRGANAIVEKPTLIPQGVDCVAFQLSGVTAWIFYHRV